MVRASTIGILLVEQVELYQKSFKTATSPY